MTSKTKCLSDYMTIQDINDCFRMEGKDLVWNVRPQHHFPTAHGLKCFNKTYANTIAGNVKSNGYRQVTILGYSFYAHRLAWVLHHNTYPPSDMQIDHINGDKLDNSRENLRLTTNSQNQMNKGKQLNNTTGYKGVYFDSTNNRYLSYIRKNSQLSYLGTFPDPEAAALAYDAAALQLHGNHAVTNRQLGLI